MDFKTIEIPNLIQRGMFRDITTEQIEGLDSLIRYDYMGSSEFEFGALAHSLRRMTYSWSQYVINTIGIQDQNDDKLYLLCRQSQFEELKSVIEALISNPNVFRTKERVCIKEYLECKSNWDMHINFWWDVTETEPCFRDDKDSIDNGNGVCCNDWMVCFGDENINKLLIAINKVCIKHERTIQGPSLFEYKKKCRETIVINDDSKWFKVTYQDKTTTLIKKNVISFEIINDVIHVSVKTRNKNNVVKINLPKSNAQLYFTNKLKEQIAFNWMKKI